MATDEFEQVGSTSGQRRAALRATEPPDAPPQKRPLESGADRVAERVLSRNPGLLAGSPSSTSPSRFEDMSDAELVVALRGLSGRGVGHTMDESFAASVSRHLED